MATKTVTLTGAEQRVDELGGLNALIVNNTDAPLYASANAGIEPYADGVIEIKAGASRGLPDTNGTVYLLGNGGRAELTGTSAGVNFSVPSSSSEGGGGITRDEVNEIVTDKIAEVVANAPEDFDTLREIADWIDGHEDSAAAMNSEIKANAADISDIQEEQQTQNADISALRTEMEQKADLSNISNTNLLINPNFKINQRGKSEYTNVTNAVDRWFLPTNGIKMSVFKDHVEVGRTDTRNGKIIQQRIPRSELDLSGKTVTFSTMVSGVNSDNNIRIWVEDSTIGSAYTTADGIYHCTAKVPDTYDVLSVGYHTFSTAPNMITPHWAKLELGGSPTPFVPPNPMEEILKCGPVETPEQKLLYGNAAWKDAPSNPNLLDNPDFKINQRGKNTYEGPAGYCVDRWFRNSAVTVNVHDGLILTYDETSTAPPSIYQILDNPSGFIGKYLTFSINSGGTVYKCTGKIPESLNNNTYLAVCDVGKGHIRIQIYNNNILCCIDSIENVSWAKLEPGDKATPFVPPHPALELLKCQRYYQRLGGSTYYCIGSGMISNPGGAMVLCPLLTSMRGNEKTIKVNINGTIYIAVKRYVGDSALSHTGMTSGATVSQNSVILPLSIESTDDSLTGCGCIAQCRDNETYVEISADLQFNKRQCKIERRF